MCTLQKRNNLFILTLTGSDQHRLNPTLIATIRSLLSEVKSQSTPGTALITVAEGNFFSNGFDLAWASSQSNGSPSEAVNLLRHMVKLFKPLVADLISLPMPTIAAVTGHAAAAGLLLAMSHDYVMMRRDRGVLYMSEVDLGMTLPDYFTVVMREKVARAEVRRDVLLRGVKVKADEAVVKGLVDSAYDSAEETVGGAVKLGEELVKRKWDGEVYGEIRKALYPEMCNVLGLTAKSVVKARL
ncbi:putative enoyl-CoA hydratase/isomerase, ClpP/crotonase-like domain superfamily [Helianthus annuus]|uniref:Delta(3)-Delta(2)-enoyl-CoA isomerase n=1 Tax=Helianthus annuus TaxID=4232 RepID=A0A251VBY8_HELAN|nr:enoyl-CoA delta isomerase 2, peroxisomal [Helianthus annuus]KAF5816623.1 putative enoyl-CoA hydratase/isomerase, ClpP/crotonase-like domain superfamily [Helianthus annuus]KAJ0594857.1 putative enoyl-CoA hydratase/isomerase, ClpP/crotonase-like domain superfamily [Helianthus annuus]KAJ0609899.1 putative enoyl-CoA hydratase/isomerase, ClpP/crotonase-like domain superfamily [Helianthus annuus]KAJ0945862.1 putative enoyl-CoA hydratase/isomerase, ClpP/crotonase-like domain superfamily [Helianthus